MKLSDHLLDLALPDPGRSRIVWSKLYGAAPSLAAAEAIARHDGPVCVIAASAAAAEQLERELKFFNDGRQTQRFTDYETLPYEPISPPQELLSERLAILYRLANEQAIDLIVHADALLQRLPPKKFVMSRSLELQVAEELDRESLKNKLIEHGYLRVEQVAEAGEFAVRGALMDIYPTGADAPVRVDFFDNEIESLRTFDTQTQLTTGETQSIHVLPAREFPFDQNSIRGFRERFRDHFPVEPGRCPVYRDISEAQLPAGIEYYLPLFFDTTESLLDYLPANSLIILMDGALNGLESGWEMIEDRFGQLCGDIERPILEPAHGFWPSGLLKDELAGRSTLRLTTRDDESTDIPTLSANLAHPLSSHLSPDLDRITRWLSVPHGERTLLLASSAGRREMLLELLRGRNYTVQSVPHWSDFLHSDIPLAVVVGELDQGLRLPDHGIRVITAEQIGMERPRQHARRRRAARDPDTLIRELTDLQVGAPVVHEEYGIGRYQGLKTLSVDEVLTEFLLLEYADGDKLYVPVHSLHLVTRYSGAPAEQAPLHRLGSDQWAKAKKKAAKRARDVAAELLNLYAQRAAKTGTQLVGKDDDYERFAREFPFEETDDQLTTIEQVIDDLASEKSMDRIVCGDVGFGKTEVALRAAFIAVHAGYQVAMLVPTTLLAQQHHRTFSDRFADWPLNVELLSRFRSNKETDAVLKQLSDGSVDVVIGTHKLLQSGIHFKRLGLVIVDEEHRFGVRHKERLRRLRAEVDVLTMTATPIPRTLNMTLGGLRDLSIIATPPAERLSVRTFIGEWSNQGMREAVLREIRRGGQVYFVHNRVESIEATAAKLRELIPETEVRVAHGQMTERSLESVMLDFYHRRFSLLVCTTIIESGIDIPTANTIIINRADRLGLAQLHQLRGRVGRSHHQAYAYLLAPPLRSLSADASKRLEAVAALQELGAGFTLATHDLEIRGAGELLGEGQSGQIQAIGFTLYNELLARAVSELREGREPNLEDPFTHGPQVETGVAALIPEDYMPDVHMRLVHYKRIASADSKEQLQNLQVELIDRFGLLPQSTRALFAVTWLKILAHSLGVEKAQAGASGGMLRFGERAVVDPLALVNLVEDEAEHYSLDGPYKLRFVWQCSEDEALLQNLEALLLRLGAGEQASEAA